MTVEQGSDCRYCPPATNDLFIAQYAGFIRRIITAFDWGGVKHLAVDQADDIFQELMIDWCTPRDDGRDYLHIYDPVQTFTNKRTGRQTRCTFDNFVYQFTSRRLLSWRDKLNRQAYHFTTECVPSETERGFSEVMINGIRFIYKRRFIANKSADDFASDQDGDRMSFVDIIADKTEPHDDVLAAIENFKLMCTTVYGQLQKIRVVSKRDYAKLFYHMVRLTMEQGDQVQQSQLADIFEVSTSTISLMIKQMRNIPAVRDFEVRLRESFVSA